MKTKLLELFVAMVLALMSSVSLADVPGPIFEPLSKDGPFVEMPANVGAIIVGLPVVVISYVVCTPTAYLYDLANDTKTFDSCMSVPSRSAAVTGAVLVGGVFYVIKKIFWDFPIWLFTKEKDPEISLTVEPGDNDGLGKDDMDFPNAVDLIDGYENLA